MPCLGTRALRQLQFWRFLVRAAKFPAQGIPSRALLCRCLLRFFDKQSKARRILLRAGLSLLRPRQGGCWLRLPRAPCLVFLEPSPHATGSAVPPHRKMCIFAPALRR